MSTAALSVRGLIKKYGKGEFAFTAVKGIDLEIRPGECVGLLGPNGAGKSTAMNCLTGFYSLSGGQVKIFGYDVHESPREARRYLGVCNQEDTLDTDFTVLDQMARYGTYFGLSLKESQERSRALLSELGLEKQQSYLVENLSGGMRRRVQVARAFVASPKLIVLDEPTTGLDPEVRRDLWNLIKRYRSSGGAILLSTHYMEEAEQLCDRVALMSLGEIIDCDTPKRLIIGYSFGGKLEDVYLKFAELHK